MKKKTCMIFGAGPSLEKNLEDYKRIGGFDGIKFVTDGALNKVLAAGIIPTYCTTLEDTSDLDKYYNTDIVKKMGSLFAAYVSDRVHPNTRKAMTTANIKYHTAAKLRGYITSNVGLFSWLLAHIIFDCNDIYMIGMDHCYEKGKPPPVHRDSELFQIGFKVRINPYNQEEIILHPAFDLWTEEFNWYLSKYEDTDLVTHNLTGRGALYDPHIKWQPISQMKTW